MERLKRFLKHKFITHSFFFVAGAVALVVYLFPYKVEFVNALVVAHYARTHIGHQTFRVTLHDACYFGIQHFVLSNKGVDIPFEYDHWCWEEADKDIERLKEGIIAL